MRRKWRAGDKQHQEEKEEGGGRRVGRRGIRSRIRNSRMVLGGEQQQQEEEEGERIPGKVHSGATEP